MTTASMTMKAGPMCACGCDNTAWVATCACGATYEIEACTELYGSTIAQDWWTYDHRCNA